MGKVIFLNDVDFSSANLGKVTLRPSDSQVISQAIEAYYAAAGSVGNEAAVTKFITDLVVYGLWDKIKVLYPVLGTTLPSLSVDMKGVQNLQPFVNATAGVNKIAFDNHIGIGDVSQLQSNVSINFGKRMFIIGMNFATGGTNTYTFLGDKSNNSDLLIRSYSTSRVLVERTIKQSAAVGVMPALGNYLCGVFYNTNYRSGGVNIPRMETFQNGVKHEYNYDSRFNMIPSGVKPLYPYVGGAWNTGTTAGATITDSSVRQTIAGCNFWFYAEAEVINTVDAVNLDRICREFCDTAKPF